MYGNYCIFFHPGKNVPRKSNINAASPVFKNPIPLPMKRIVPFLLACFCFGGTLSAQSEEKELPECLVEFPEKRIKVDEPVMAQIDSAWDVLKRGNRIRLRVLDKEENKMDDERRYILSQKRCSTIIDYLVKKDIAVVSYAVSMEPFGKTKKHPVSEVSNGAYRGMTNVKGLYSIILYKEGFEPIPFTGSDSMVLAWKDCQEFTGNPNSKIEIYGREGTIIRIEANSLVYMDGTPVTCASVKFCLREYYSKSDMIAAGLTTHSYGRMLISGGMIHIEAKCNDKKLRLLSGKPMTVMFPTNGAKKEKGMRTFYGRHTDGLTNWLPSIREEGQPQKETPKTVVDSETGETYDSEGESEEEYSKLDYYFMQSSRLGWINCDKFYEEKDPVDLYVKSDTALKPAIRMVFTDLNSVLPGYYYSADKTVKFDNIPKGRIVNVVAIAQKGDKYYFGSGEVKTGSERIIEVPVTQMTKAEFEKRVLGVN
ncbi:MAG: hypothetical protein FD123_2737 [Bacteroidetes bacterium]|nr:MAG: hypothetical protein FD123_2737 [Bacteroidota bacterium]